MLGYDFDLEKMKQTEIIKKRMVHATMEGETYILNILKEICQKFGIVYSKYLKINRANYMANAVLVDDILQYPEDKTLLEKLQVYDCSSFYRKHYCEPSSPFYINRIEGKFDLFYVSSIIRESGGKVFLAHPFVYKLPNLESFLDELVTLNVIDRIECYHRKHKKRKIIFSF